jgi:two-component system, NarL family, sensor histidine kinase LiaS
LWAIRILLRKETSIAKTAGTARKLQGQLLRSYMLSTIAVVLVIDALWFSQLITPTLLYLREPDRIVRDVDSEAPAAAAYLTANPPQTAELTRYLRELVGDVSIVQGQSRFAISYLIDIPPWAYVAVTNASGKVVAHAPRGAWLDNEPLAAQLGPEDRALVAGALAGKKGVRHMPYPPKGRRTHVAVPVYAKSGEVCGMVFVRHDVPGSFRDIIASLLLNLVQGLVMTGLLAALVGAIAGWISARGIVRRLDRIATAASAWSGGDFGARIATGARDELGRLSEQLNNTAGRMSALMEEQRQYAVNDERARLARDLHDTVKQQAFAAAMQLAAAQAKLRSDPADAQRHIEQAAETVQQVQRDLSAIVLALHPGPDEGAQDLGALLRSAAESWSHQAAIPVRLHLDRGVTAAWDLALPLVRILQGALSNVARHSGAKLVKVTLALEARRLVLCLEDDGCGFTTTPERLAAGGLAVMRERAAALPSGSLEIESAPGRGTRVCASCKLGEEQ